MELDPKQRRKLEKLAGIIEKGDVATLEHLFEIEERIEDRFEKTEQLVKTLAEKDVLSNVDMVKIRGEKGEKGEDGKDGKMLYGMDGADGKDGLDGRDGRDGIDGKDGKNGIDGVNGINGKDGRDGKDADEEAIIEKVEKDLPKLGESIRNSLELLEGEERLERKAIKGGEYLIDQPALDRAVSILDQRTSFLINKVSNLAAQGTGGGGGGADVTLAGEDYLSIAGQQITANAIDLDNLSATGTPSGATFLRGDNTWATPAGSGDVSKVGTPVNNQVGVWTGDGTIEGDADLTFDTTTNTLATINATATGTVGIGTTVLTQIGTGFGASSQLDKLFVVDQTAGKISTIVVGGEAGGAIQFTDEALTPTADFGLFGTDLFFVNRQNGPTYFYNNGGLKMTILANGNIGIGTTAPDKKLEINLGTSDAFRLTYNDANGSAATYFDTTIDSGGIVTFNAVGSGPSFVFADSISLGSNSLALTGSIASTGSRVTKGWFTDLEVTNMPTVGGTSLSSTFQPLDSDLTTIAGLTATTDSFIQSKSSAWASRTVAQVKTDLGVSNVDNTSDSTKNSATATLTNKRITKRTDTTASSGTPTINTDNVDFYSITALAADITSFTTNLSGTPTTAQLLWIAITDNGSPRAITWGASFQSSGMTILPSTTVTSVRLDVGFVWTGSIWRCIAVS